MSCDENPDRPLLEPTGSEFVSAYSAIQVVGELNNWDTNAPSMTEIAGGIWADTLVVEQGCYFIKFRTDNDWDETPDFGRCSGTESDCQLEVPVAPGQLLEDGICPVTGSGTAIGQLEFVEDGPYEFVVDERTQTFRVRKLTEVGAIAGMVEFEGFRLLPVAAVSLVPVGGTSVITNAFSDSSDGSYRIDDIPPGTYDLLIRAPEYLDERVDSVKVVAFQVTVVEPVVLSLGCQSAYTRLQVVGDFNNFDAFAPFMSSPSPCVWADTLLIDAGCHFIKFRTENNWDETPDFGRCSGSEGVCQSPVPADGSALTAPACPVTGAGTAIGELEFAVSGSYEFLLDEASATYAIRRLGVTGATGTISGNVGFSDDPPFPHPTVHIAAFDAKTNELVSEVMSNEKDRFSLDLDAGTYDLLFFAPFYEIRLILGVVVAPSATTTLGTVLLERTPAGSISGSVAFSDNPSPSPTVSIGVFLDGELVRTAQSDSTTNTFLVSDLLSGTYTLSFAAPGYAEHAVTDVVVTAPDDTGIGIVTLQRVGSISGGVAFTDDPKPSPVVTITVLEGGTSNLVTVAQSNPVSDLFLITNLVSGAYDLLFEASGYLDATRSGVVVNAPANTSVGTVTLTFDCVSRFTSMQVVGGFNGFDPDAPLMSQTASCVWADTLTIAAGCYLVKFRTNDDFDETPDFGRCSGSEGTCQTVVPVNGSALTQSVCEGTGLGNALGELQFLVPPSASYEFILHEDTGTFSVRRLVGLVGARSGP
jgi:hypothetical protein